jgi:hypothetical protein
LSAAKIRRPHLIGVLEFGARRLKNKFRNFPKFRDVSYSNNAWKCGAIGVEFPLGNRGLAEWKFGLAGCGRRLRIHWPTRSLAD